MPNWEVLLNFGVGGALACVCLYLLYNEMRRNATEAQKKSDEHAKVLEAHIATLNAHISRLESRDQASVAVIQANTAALVGLHEAVGKLASYTEIIGRLQNVEDRLSDGYPPSGNRRQPK